MLSKAKTTRLERARKRKAYKQRVIYKYNALSELDRILDDMMPNPDLSVFDGDNSLVGKIFEERPDLRKRIMVREYRL